MKTCSIRYCRKHKRGGTEYCSLEHLLLSVGAADLRPYVVSVPHKELRLSVNQSDKWYMEV